MAVAGFARRGCRCAEFGEQPNLREIASAAPLSCLGRPPQTLIIGTRMRMGSRALFDNAAR